MTAPVLTIFVRHTPTCKYRGDEFSKRCSCRKHFRWSANGEQHRRKAGTRSWAEAETLKRDLEDQLSGKSAPVGPVVRALRESVEVFIKDKRVSGVTEDVLAKYTRELGRLCDYCESENVFVVSGLTREVLTGYAATWKRVYPSSQTRSSVRARCRGFLRYCYEAQWLERIPALPKITVDEAPTMPLTAEEFERLLEAVQVVKGEDRQRRVRALFLLMRWTGLAIRDALTLKSSDIANRAGRYQVTTARQKTGTHVSVPLPPEAARAILAAPNDNPLYVFWDGSSDIVKTWTKYFVAPVFKAARLHGVGYMTSHRLRDTFAVDLLEKGVAIGDVSKLLGHESIKTTEKSYAKWVKGRQDRLDKIVSDLWAA